MVGFNTPVDIANRALQHVGAALIQTLQDDDKGAAQIAQCYDGLREAELRRNVWTFACRRSVLYPVNTAGVFPLNTTNGPVLPTVRLVPPTWLATKAYSFGAVVSYGGSWWSCIANAIQGEVPGAGLSWETYFGAKVVQPYAGANGGGGQGGTSTLAYYTGDLVYETLGNVTQVFRSLQNGNTNDPATFATWASATAYTQGQIVADAQGYWWTSMLSNNLGNQPGVYGVWSSAASYVTGEYAIGSDSILYVAIASGTNQNPANSAAPTYWTAVGTPGSWPVWNAATTYTKGALVAGMDGNVYLAVQGSNTGHQPVGSTYNPNTPASNWWVPNGIVAPWMPASSGMPAGNPAWLNLGASTAPLNIGYPAGSGPAVQEASRNVFMLPYGYLRKAPQEPKRGSVSFMGSPTGLMYDDWEFNADFIISQAVYPIVFRFVGNVTQVHTMDAEFCEGLGCRIGLAICEPLTQSAQKKRDIMAAYQGFMDTARLVNGIEQGPTEAAEDDWITTRL